MGLEPQKFLLAELKHDGLKEEPSPLILKMNVLGLERVDLWPDLLEMGLALCLRLQPHFVILPHFKKREHVY